MPVLRSPLNRRGGKLEILGGAQTEEADNHFGWFAHFAALDCPASSVQTQEQLGWRPTQASLLPDIDQPCYFEANQRTFDRRGATK